MAEEKPNRVIRLWGISYNAGMETQITPPENSRASQQSAAAGAMGALVRTARKIVVLIVGVTVLLVGVVMIVAPGPAMVVIPLGLGILATEFVWAARMLKQLQDQASSLGEMTLSALFLAAARNSLWPIPRRRTTAGDANTSAAAARQSGNASPHSATTTRRQASDS